MEAAILATDGSNEELRRYIEQFLPVRLDASE